MSPAPPPPASPRCAPEVAKLARDDGPLQMSVFDAQDMAEIAHRDYPYERLIACRNPLLGATEKPLAPIVAGVGKVIRKGDVAKHFD